MEKKFDLQRFIDAQNYHDTYDLALQEIRNGCKENHWIWFVFPQLEGLGFSHMSRRYGIQGMAEAKAYMENDLLRSRLLEISEALYDLECRDLMSVVPEIDAYKIRSSCTLFAYASPECEIFRKLLDKYCGGTECQKTVWMLEGKE